MRLSVSIVLVLLVLTASSISASLPRIAVVSIDADDFSPDGRMISSVIDELESSGRFVVVDLGEAAFIDTTPDSLLSVMGSTAAENALDIFLALEVLPDEQDERTVFRGDSLTTFRMVEVTVLGRFYSSAGTLLGTIRHTETREGEIPFIPDRFDLARSCAVILAERSVLELFPLEVTFVYEGGRRFSVPIGTVSGIRSGTVMSVVASSTVMPTDPDDYQELRSRGLLQIIDAGPNESSARLLSGRLVMGGSVTALEQSAPAVLTGGYVGSAVSVELGEDLDMEEPGISSGIRFAAATGRWGLSLGGGFTAGILEHASCLGVDLAAGTRIPIGSPQLGLRLTGGGEVFFLMQDVRSDTLRSDATAVVVNGRIDADLEYLFSDHLGIELGCTGILGTEAGSWTVQEYTGRIRDANPDELYYTKLRWGPVSFHAGIFYLVF